MLMLRVANTYCVVQRSNLLPVRKTTYPEEDELGLPGSASLASSTGGRLDGGVDLKILPKAEISAHTATVLGPSNVDRHLDYYGSLNRDTS